MVTTDHLSVLQSEIRSELRDWQNEDLPLVLPALYVGAAICIAAFTGFEDTLKAGLITLVLLILPLAVLGLRRVGYLAAVWLLVAGGLVCPLLLVVWENVAAAVLLMAAPVGLAALFIGVPTGLGLALACSLFLAIAPQTSLPVDSVLRFVTVLQLWETVGLVWLTKRPLLSAMQWYWASYKRNDVLLEQARDTQVQLKQVLEDLEHANVQLTRLNRFAETMRLAAEEARRVKQEFVANVSHELRTPLNMIVGFSQMIVQAPDVYGSNLSPTLLADLDIVLRNSQHLSKLIDDVLDLSQIETEHMALTMERVSLGEVIDAGAVATRPLFESKRLYLNVDVASSLPAILCDRTRIRQVVLNLLSNAGRFTERGGVTVRAWQDGPDVLVSVADTGQGIAPDAMGRLFRPFQQIDGSIRRRYGGSGLGLSISKSFIEMHGGKIWVESTEDSGTTFFFRLPVDPPVGTDGGVARWFNPYAPFEERPRRSVAPIPVVRPRLLVYETGQALQRLLARYLDGTEIVAVSSLDAAVSELHDNPAQALIVNEVSVGKTLQSLAETGLLPYGTPIIVCSIPGAYEAAGDLGAHDYLVKPISRDKLLGALDKLTLKRKTILIVEDDREAMRLFRRMLASARQKYRVLRATDGMQGMKMVREERPDVVLLDLMMPKTDGFHFLAEKNQETSLRDIPVIIISARDPTGQLIVSNALGVTQDGGLSVSQLLACIRAISGILATSGPVADQALPGKPGG